MPVFNKFKTKLLQGLNLENNLAILLVENWNTYDIDTSQFVNEVTGESAGIGYERKLLTNVSAITDTINDKSNLSADDIVWTSSSFTTSGGVLYVSASTDDTTNPMIGVIPFGQSYTSTNENFTLSLSANNTILDLS